MRFLFSIATLLICTRLVAQVDVQVGSQELSADDSLRTRFIKSYPHHFAFWPVLKQRRINFDLVDLPERNKRIIYRTNKPYALGVGLYIFEVTFELIVAIPLNEKRNEYYGESKTRDLQGSIYTKKWSADGYLQRYDGFYVDDPDVKIPANQPYLQRPDISIRNIGVNGNYIFNHKKFSFRAPYNYADRQLHSAGSIIVSGTVAGFSVRGDSAILSANYVDDFGDATKIREIKSNTLSIAPGYSYTIVHKGFFVNGTMALGLAHNWLSYENEDGSSRDNILFSVAFSGRLSLGYSDDKHFGGVSYVTQGNNAKFENLRLNSSTGTLKVYFGWRLREFGFLKKRISDLPKLVGIGKKAD